MITESEFRALAAQGYNRIPLVLETFADLDTPLSLYLKLARERYSFLLESVVGGERFGRYSFIGLPAKVRLRVRGRHTEVEDDDRRHRGARRRSAGVHRSRFAQRFRAAPLPGLPRFCGGLAGYFGYDTVRHIETRLAHSGKPPTPGPGRRSRHAAAAHRGARGRRQPGRQDLADRLRRPGGARRLRGDARRGSRNCGASCASRWRFRSRPATAITTGDAANSARRATRRRSRARRSTSPPATSCRR